jgi:hypothetical protein
MKLKRYLLIFIVLLIISCDDDAPNQFTSVEGYVTDYSSKEPVAGIPLLISEYDPFEFCDFCDQHLITDTVFSDSIGYYYYEFYNKEDRTYEINPILKGNYYFYGTKTIYEGKPNTINLEIKPFKNLTLNCYNQSTIFNSLYVHSLLNNESFLCYPCEKLAVFTIKIVNEEKDSISIELRHYNEKNKADTTRSESIVFFNVKNDTIINYYF